MEIKDYFSHWIKNAAEVGKVPADKYESRITAIQELTEEINVDEALNLLRIYCNSTQDGGDTLQKFARHFQEHDPSVDIQDNAFIFQVLAGISLIQILSNTGSYAADAISLGLSTRTFQWTRKVLPDESVSVDLETIAKKYLSEESNQIRRLDQAIQIPVTDKKASEINIKELKTLAEQTPTAGISATNALTLFTTANKAISEMGSKFPDLVTHINNAFTSLYNAIKINTEETNIFWWLAGEWSRDLECPFEDLSTTEACLVIGKELSDLTQFQPGHNSAKGFLHRIIKLTDNKTEGKQTSKIDKGNITFKEAINKTPDRWKLDWLKASTVQEVLEFCPIHFALLKRQELDDNTWPKSFEQKTGIKPLSPFSFLELSYQFYQERLMVKAAS